MASITTPVVTASRLAAADAVHGAAVARARVAGRAVLGGNQATPAAPAAPAAAMRMRPPRDRPDV